MTLFTDTTRPTGRRRRGWSIATASLVLIALVALIVVGFSPAPYAVESPGPVFNTLGSATDGGAEHTIISISNAPTYPTAGTLDMLTVNVTAPGEHLRWVDVVSARLDPRRAVVPIDQLYPPNQTANQSNAEQDAEMRESQQSATAAALREQGIPFTTTITVAQTAPGFPAAGVLKKGDVITSVNGKSYLDTTSLREAIEANGTSHPLSFTILRDGATLTVPITPRATGTPSTPVVGVVLSASYRFPVKVAISLQDVGGPSAGMMFALGIIDKMTPGYLNGGKKIAGTGTITASGEVGAIGGIRQKMYGAKAAGAQYFLAPASNCGGADGVRGHIPPGLKVYSTTSLAQSITVLKAIASGKGLSSLPTCGTE